MRCNLADDGFLLTANIGKFHVLMLYKSGSENKKDYMWPFINFTPSNHSTDHFPRVEYGKGFLFCILYESRYCVCVSPPVFFMFCLLVPKRLLEHNATVTHREAPYTAGICFLKKETKIWNSAVFLVNNLHDKMEQKWQFSMNIG